jgi:hypothetical protein
LSEPTSKRLVFLEKITAEGSVDPMAFYSLAMEYRGLGRHDEALQTFTSLRSNHPEYVPMYLMCGQMLEKLERFEDARNCTKWVSERPALRATGTLPANSRARSPPALRRPLPDRRGDRASPLTSPSPRSAEARRGSQPGEP